MEGPVLRSFSYIKQELGIFDFLEIVAGWLLPSTAEDPAC